MTTPKVLAVDDRYENLVAVENVLSGMNLEIIKAGSGEEALALVMRHQFALVLLDVQMPGMDGFETATLLRSHQDSRSIPIIFVTAISKDDEYAFRGYETGAVDFLFKPIDPTVLRGKVKVFLDLYEQRAALEQEITHRKQIEADLISARTAAESANRAKSDFLANMSHELRTPMNSIIGFTQRVLKRGADTLDERSVDALETVDRNAHQLLDLINDILDMSRIDSGRMDLQTGEFDAIAEIRDVLQQLEPLVEPKPIELLAELPDTAIPVTADQTKFGQIVRNLVTNAIKYTDEGTVTVRASAMVSSRSGNTSDDTSSPQSLRLDIEDTGIGIKESDCERLFDRFSQLDSATTRRAGGTGLGLYITSTYVRMHLGSITVHSEFGTGSTFTVELPIVVNSRQIESGSFLDRELQEVVAV